MSSQKDNDGSKKPSHAATNPAFKDDENLTEQAQEAAEQQQKDTIKVPNADQQEDSGVYVSGSQDPIEAAGTSTPKPGEKEKSEQSRKVKRTPSMEKLKAGAEALYRNMKEAVKTVLRSSSSSPKKETLKEDDEEEEQHEQSSSSSVKIAETKTKKEKRPFSMMSMVSIDTDTESIDSGLTGVSTLPESETFDQSVAPLPSDDSVEDLPAEEGDKAEDDKMELPEADKSESVEMETDLPESDKYKESGDNTDEDDSDKSGDNLVK